MEKREVPFGRPWITDEDRAAVMAVLSGHVLTHGPKCHEFEERFAAMMGGGHAITTSSAMASLHLAYLHFKVGPGDEVLVPAQTHVATVHAVELTGATPVFVDCELETGNMSVEGMKAAITPRTKAIGLVHFAGIPVNMTEVMKLAGEHGLKVVEDCALAIGARWDGVHAGLWGDCGCYSFYPVKHITTGEGGMFVSKHEDVIAKVANFRAFSYDRSRFQGAIPGLYDVHDVGLNYRMSEMQAALGCTQLDKLPAMLERRAANFRRLKDVLGQAGGLISVLDANDPRAASAHYCLIAVLRGKAASKRDEIVRAVNQRGVGTSVYYPQPTPRLSYYAGKYGYDPARYQGAATISDCSFALPVGPHLDLEDVNYVGHTVCEVVESLTR